MMPTITVKAPTQDALPPPPQFQTWLQAWSQASGAYAVWGQPTVSANQATINVVNLTVEQISGIIQPSIYTYNQTHSANDVITVVIEK